MVFFLLNVSLYGRHFQPIIQTLLFAKYLHRFCYWFESEWLGRSLIPKKKCLESFFLIVVDFWVLSKREENTAEHIIMNKALDVVDL